MESLLSRLRGPWYHYLASPYSSPQAAERDYRYGEAMRATAWLIRQQVWTFSPILHAHEMAKFHQLPTDAASWQQFNHSMIIRASRVIFLVIPGWQESKGMREEARFTHTIGMPALSLYPAPVGYELKESHPRIWAGEEG